MVTTILGLLAFLALVCFLLWLVVRPLSQWLRRSGAMARGRMRDLTGRIPTRPSAGGGRSANPAPWIPIPPDTMLLRTDTIPIAQAGNPTPMLRTRAINGTALWYRAPMSYREVVTWYTEHLPDDGWREEPGHDAVHVFQRASTLLWLADGSDPHVWRRITRPNLDPPRRTEPPDEATRPTFTILTYRTDGYAAPR
jgi:hypothetical protein